MIKINWLDFICFLPLDCFWKSLHSTANTFAYKDSPPKMLDCAISG
jgi:hypothetical protein